MKVVDADKLKLWIAQNEFDSTTPIPPEPPVCPAGYHWDGVKCVPDVVPPTPPSVPIGTPGVWGAMTPFFFLGTGATAVYNVSLPPSISQISIQVYPVDPTSEGVAKLYFPNGYIHTLPYRYQINANFNLRTQKGPGPNLPFDYFPDGIYAVELIQSGSGTMRIFFRTFS